MTTYSTVLKLELPGDGQQVGTWGQTTNKNFGTLVEQAITGVKYITMIDADYTLTDLNGASDEARNAVIIAQGTNNAIRKVIIPLNNKVYLISNQTVGGYSIRIGASTGNYVTVPNGITAFVYCDGTNTISGSNGSVDNFTINGALSVTGNATITGNTSLGGTLGVTGAASFTNTVGFTVTPTAPTQLAGTNNTTLATTAFVTTAVSGGLATLGTMALQNANNVNITGGTMSGMTSIAGGTISGTTGTFSGAVSGTTGTFSGAVSGTTGTFSGALSAASASFSAALPVASGGTGTTTSTGTGSVVLSASPTLTGSPLAPTQSSSDNSTKIATTAYVTTAITNLALGTMSTQNSNNVNITGGTITGSYGLTAANATQAANATAVNGTNSNGYGNRTVSSSAPTGGSNGDIWYQV